MNHHDQAELRMAPSSHTASLYAFSVIGAAWLRKHNAPCGRIGCVLIIRLNSQSGVLDVTDFS
jgi:hypothetical protein